MRNVMWGAGVALLLGAAGCTSGTPAYLPSEDESPEAATTGEAIVVEALPEPSPSSSPSVVTVVPDAALVATMECEPLSADLLDKMRIDFGTPTRSVQVEAGEGLEAGSKWWVVILDSPPFENEKGGLRRFLTNAQETAQADDPEWNGKWISLEEGWGNVVWDVERLTRAQSALVKAESCLPEG